MKKPAYKNRIARALVFLAWAERERRNGQEIRSCDTLGGHFAVLTINRKRVITQYCAYR